jgi:hypothetical protein
MIVRVTNPSDRLGFGHRKQETLCVAKDAPVPQSPAVINALEFCH